MRRLRKGGRQMANTLEKRDYREACEELFLAGGIDTPIEVKQIRERDYTRVWRQLLDAGFLPDEAIETGA